MLPGCLLQPVLHLREHWGPRLGQARALLLPEAGLLLQVRAQPWPHPCLEGLREPILAGSPWLGMLRHALLRPSAVTLPHLGLLTLGPAALLLQLLLLLLHAGQVGLPGGATDLHAALLCLCLAAAVLHAALRWLQMAAALLHNALRLLFLSAA